MTEDSLQFRFMRYLNEMDFQSQPKAERFFKLFIPAIAIISYLIASVMQQFSVCVISTLAATVISYIVVVPGQAPWWRRPLPEFQPDEAKEKPKKA